MSGITREVIQSIHKPLEKVYHPKKNIIPNKVKMKKGQLMGQPIMYLFYAMVGAMILFFGIKVIIGLQETGEDVEYASFISDLRKSVETVYSDASGSTYGLEKITIPGEINEICFVGDYEEGVVSDPELDTRIQLIDDYSESNLFFGGVDLDKHKHKLDVVVSGIICDSTRDRKLNLILENMGTYVAVK
jgi:hypothetical protein